MPYYCLSGNSAAIIVSGSIFLLLLPVCHIGIINNVFWVPDKKPVDFLHCNCSCFDTINRGPYEDVGTSWYKHFYFNTTQQMMYIWMLVVAALICLYELIRRVSGLYSNQSLRSIPLLMLIVAGYPIYYGWWNLIMAINDGFYWDLTLLLYLTIPQFFTAGVLNILLNLKTDVKPWHLLLLFALHCDHTFLATFWLMPPSRWSRLPPFIRWRNIGLYCSNFINLLLSCVMISKLFGGLSKAYDALFGQFRRQLYVTVCAMLCHGLLYAMITVFTNV